MSSPAIRFPEFETEWEQKQLSEIAQVKGGKRLPKGFTLLSEDNGLPYITVTDMFSGGIDCSRLRFVPKDAFPAIKNYTIKREDIFISVAGTLGVVGIVPESLNGASLTENANKITDIKCNQQYLLQYLLSERLSDLIKSVQTVGAQPKLAIYALNAFKVLLPDRIEQQKIASFLNAIDTRIDQLTRKHALLVEYKKGVMQKIFSQEVRFRDVDGNGFPPWKQCALGETSDIVMGQSPNSSSYNTDGDGLPLVQGNADISGRKTIIRSWTNDPGKVCNAGDIILTVRAPVGSVAKAAFDSCLGRGVCALQAREKYSRDFVFQMLFWFEEFRWRSVSQGAIFDAINGNDIKGLDVEIPSLPEQIKIATFLNGLDEQIERANGQMNETKKYKQGLLQVMFV